MFKRKRVLIYIDFVSIRDIIIRQLELREFDILVSYTISDVLNELNGTSIDLFITDIDQKGNTARQIIKHMRETTNYLFTPIILLISGSKEIYQKELEEFNIAMCLPKPFDISILCKVLDRISKK